MVTDQLKGVNENSGKRKLGILNILALGTGGKD
jgi:hypothetical protein